MIHYYAAATALGTIAAALLIALRQRKLNPTRAPVRLIVRLRQRRQRHRGAPARPEAHRGVGPAGGGWDNRRALRPPSAPRSLPKRTLTATHHAVLVSFAINASVNSKLPFDPIRDFAPIILVARVPQILIVHPAVAARSVSELIALARAKPGQLNYASAGSGSSNHLAMELFSAMAGIS